MLKFDGKYHAAKIDKYIHSKIKTMEVSGDFLIILIGDNQASLNYIKFKTKLLESFNIKVRFEHIPANTSDEQIINKVLELFNLTEVRGGLVQFPLPRPELNRIVNMLPPNKDIDVISSTNIERFMRGDFSYLSPVVRAFTYFMLTALDGDAQDITEYIDVDRAVARLKEKLVGSAGYIIGDGVLVGKPIYHFTQTLGASIRNDVNYHKGEEIYSDFLVLGTGVPNLVDGKDIKNSCHVIDFGTSFVDQKVTGDLDKSSSMEHLGLVALSPGGMGPIVTRFLLLNFLELPKDR